MLILIFLYFESVLASDESLNHDGATSTASSSQSKSQQNAQETKSTSKQTKSVQFMQMYLNFLRSHSDTASNAKTTKHIETNLEPHFDNVTTGKNIS